MKLKNGFVSNSSTTSFVCEVCNYVEAGMDISIEETDMVSCERGHTFCDEHGNGDIGLEDIKQYFHKYFEPEYRRKHKEEDVKEFLEMVDKGSTVSEIESFVENDGGAYDVYSSYKYYSVPWKRCPICTLNYITSEDALAFVKKAFGKDAKEEIKASFSSLEELADFLHDAKM